MHLTRFTDLSLRVLMYLTYSPRSALVTVTELSDRFEWSRNHMVKVVHFLSLKGWISTQRGRSGGITLAKPANEYRIGDLVRTLEAQTPLIDCFDPKCPLSPACSLRITLDEALEAFYEKLNEKTLEDLTMHHGTRTLITSLNEVPVLDARNLNHRSGMTSSALIRQMQERVTRETEKEEQNANVHMRGIRSRRN